MHQVYQQGEFEVSTDPARLDVGAIHQFLTYESYWAQGMERALLEKALAHSLNFGLYTGSRQIGLARVVTDYATFAYLCDVYVHADFRGRGLGQWLMGCVVAHPDLHGVSAEDFQRIYAVNTIGTFQMMRAAAPHLKASGKGSIVNISSRAALMGSGSSIPYAASKAAVNALTMALARVLAPEVRVNAVCPALVEQGFVERLAPESFAKRREHQINVSPLHRIGHPDEVAETIWWLTTGASMMTGAIVELDFGMHLNAV